MADIAAVLRRALSTSVLRWFMVAYLGAAVAVTLGLFLYAELARRDASEDYVRAVLDNQSRRIGQLAEQLHDLRAAHDALGFDAAALERLEHALAVAAELDDTDAAAIERRLAEVEQLAQAADASARDLAALLNPGPPHELLTVVRLGDRFEFFGRQLDVLQQDIDSTRQDLQARLDQNHEQTAARIDNLFLTIQVFAAVVLPILLLAVKDVLPRRPGTEPTPPR